MFNQLSLLVGFKVLYYGGMKWLELGFFLAVTREIQKKLPYPFRGRDGSARTSLLLNP
jgi:hypothetical protein